MYSATTSISPLDKKGKGYVQEILDYRQESGPTTQGWTYRCSHSRSCQTATDRMPQR
jgi:hypothetical protein